MRRGKGGRKALLEIWPRKICTVEEKKVGGREGGREGRTVVCRDGEGG